MTQEQTKKVANWPLIWAIGSFVFGFLINGFVNYMSYTNKVDLLTAEVTQLTSIVAEMNKKLDDGNTKYFDIDKRVSLLEAEKRRQ